MALVTSSSSVTSKSDPTAALREALVLFENALTVDQKLQYQNASIKPVASDVVAFVVQVDSTNQNRARRCVASRLCTFLDRTQQFVGVVDTFVSARPNIAALIWGGIKLTIFTASNIAAYFDKVTSMIMDISRLCPVYEQFGQLFASSVELQRALCEYYAVVVRLCIKIMEIAERNTLGQLLSSVWNPFESEFKVFRDEFDRAMKNVKVHISLASKQASFEAAKLLAIDREENRKNWSTLFASRSEMKQERRDAHQWRLRQTDRQKTTLRLSIRDNLSTINHLKVWKHIHQQRAPCTAEWLQDDQHFLKWREDVDTSILWCPGILGVGKTVLMSHVIGHLQQTRSSTDIVCHHFCRFEDSASLSTRMVLGTIARQMLDIQIESLDLDELTSLNHLVRNLDTEELLEILLPRLEERLTYYVIIDGLDEMQHEDLQNLAKIINDLCDKRPQNLKIVLTGRPELESHLFARKHFDHKITITKSGTLEDVERFSMSVLDQCLEEKKLVLNDQNLILKIVEILKRESEGIFLWTRLFIEEICAQPNDNEILRALENPPRKISQLLDRKLVRIRKHHAAQQAIRVLKYCGGLKRPLAVDEYRELISLSVEQQGLDKGNLPNNMVEVVTACHGLVFVEEEESTIHYVHQSVRQYLFTSGALDTDAINESELELHIGKLCLTYLNFNDFQRQVVRHDASSTLPLAPVQFGFVPVSNSSNVIAPAARTLLRLRRQHKNLSVGEIERKARELSGFPDPVKQQSELQVQQFSFLKYAKKYWIYHLTHLDTEHMSRSWSLFCRCVGDKDSLAEKPWAKEGNLPDMSSVVVEETLDMCCWCTTNGHHAVLLYIAQREPNAMDEDMKQHVLQSATFLAHSRSTAIVVRWMKCKEKTLRAGLFHAITNGHTACVEAYVNAHSSADLLQAKGEITALKLAVQHGHLKVAELLLIAGADINASGYDGHTALHVAAQENHEEIVKLLLAAGADINASRFIGRTALLVAAQKNHHGIVKLLLAAGADMTATDYSGHTALYLAADMGYAKIVKELLVAGADVNASTKDGWTALRIAVETGRTEVVKELLVADIDVDAPSANQELTALYIAAANGDTEIMKALLAAGANVNASTKDGWTALYIAAERGHTEVVKALLVAGANVRATYMGGWTVLTVAVERGQTEVAELLRAAGAVL